MRPTKAACTVHAWGLLEERGGIERGSLRSRRRGGRAAAHCHVCVHVTHLQTAAAVRQAARGGLQAVQTADDTEQTVADGVFVFGAVRACVCVCARAK